MAGRSAQTSTREKPTAPAQHSRRKGEVVPEFMGTAEGKHHHPTTPSRRHRDVQTGRRNRSSTEASSPKHRSSQFRVKRRASTHYSQDEDRLLTLIARHGSLAFDLETKGLHPHASENAQVGAVIVKAGKERFIFREFPDWWDEVLADQDTRKIGSNLKFDMMWCVARSRLPIARNLQDIMIKSQINNRYRTPDGAAKAGMRHLWEPNDLASILKRVLNVDIKKGQTDNPYKIYHEDVWAYDTSWEKYYDEELGKERRRQVKTPVELLHKGVDWTGAWTSEMEEYMLEDIDFLEPANDELDRRIVKEGQERVSWIENNSVFATAWMTFNGITPDVSGWSALLERQRKEYQHLLWHARKEFPDVRNFASNPQVKAAIESLVEMPLQSVDKFILKQIAPHYKGVAVLQDMRIVQTRLKNWGGDYIQRHLCTICARFHPDWRQIGAETMRGSCSRPNLQQMPRDRDYRRLFIAAPNHVLASLDYSAIEVLTAAVFANCPGLLEACLTGNPHAAKAADAMGISFEAWQALPDQQQKDTRQLGKIVNFGMLFGGGKAGLMEQARNLFNYPMTEDEADSLIKQHYAQYPELKRSRNMAYHAFEEPGPVEVRTMVGMRRWLEGHNRKATSWLNTVIQSTAAHGIKSSYRYLMECGLLPYLCMQIHDELLFEFPTNKPRSVGKPIELAEIAYECMLKGMQEVLGETAPIRIEWGEETIGKVWL